MGDGRGHAVAAGILFLILAGLIFLTANPRYAASGPETLLREVMAPAQSAIATVSQWARESVGSLASLRQLSAENRELRRQVALLEAELLAAEHDRAENARLREMLALSERLPHQSVAARVIARSSEHWFSTVTINRGKNDGIRAGMPVVTEAGVVGHVESVTPNSARVILLVDPKGAVGGVVLESQTPVLVEGGPDLTGQQLTVRPLVHGRRLQVGDAVVTSGLSQMFPAGIPIGVISSVDQGASPLHIEARLAPAVDFRWLDWVMVLVDAEEGDGP